MPNFINYTNNYYSQIGLVKYFQKLGITISKESIELKKRMGVLKPSRYSKRGKAIYPMYSKAYVDIILKTVSDIKKIDWRKVKEIPVTDND